MAEYPKGNGDTYIRHFTTVRVDVSEQHFQAHKYIDWCFRDYSRTYRPLRTFDVLFNGLGDVDRQCADEDLASLEVSFEEDSDNGPNI